MADGSFGHVYQGRNLGTSFPQKGGEKEKELAQRIGMDFYVGAIRNLETRETDVIEYLATVRGIMERNPSLKKTYDALLDEALAHREAGKKFARHFSQ